MKSKSFVTTLLGIFLSLSIASCSNEDVVEQQTVSQRELAFQELNKKLQDYSDSYISEVQTRGRFCDFFKKIGRVIKADITGVSVKSWRDHPNGMVNTGINISLSISASIQAASESFTKPLEDAYSDTETQQAIEEAYVSVFDPMVGSIEGMSAGYLHNKVILNLAKNQPEVFTSDAETVVAAVTHELIGLGIPLVRGMESQIVEDLTKLETFISMDNIDQSFKLLYQMYPSRKNEIECIEIYVDCLSNAQSVEDALKISKDFQEMFAESFIDPDFEAIFSVGGGSSALWGITME